MKHDERYVKSAVNRDCWPPNPVDEIANPRNESFRDGAEYRSGHERFELGRLVSLGQTEEQERKTSRDKPNAAGKVRCFSTIEKPRRNSNEYDEYAAHRDGQTRKSIPPERTEHEEEHAERPHEKQRSRKKNHQWVSQVHRRNQVPSKIRCDGCEQKPRNNGKLIVIARFDTNN